MKQVVFENDGLLDLSCIDTFGVSVKENENPIGQFGTGLKYALAVLMREKQKVQIIIGGKLYTVFTNIREIRGQDFEGVVLIDDEGKYTQLPFTTTLAKNWELWMAFREIYSNCKDENGRMWINDNIHDYESRHPEKTAILVTGEEFADIVKQKADVFIESKPILETREYNVHKGSSPFVYSGGIRIAEFEKPLMHTYDLKGKVDLTEDRTMKDPSEVEDKIVRTVVQSEDARLIEEVVLASEEHHESSFSFRYLTLGNTFLEVMKRLIRKKTPGLNPTAVAKYEEQVREKRKTRDQLETYKIKLKRPPGVTKEQMRDYIQTAVASWQGGGNPEDPINQIDRTSIEVSNDGWF